MRRRVAWLCGALVMWGCANEAPDGDVAAARRHIPSSFKVVFGPSMAAAKTGDWAVYPAHPASGRLTLAPAAGVAVDRAQGGGVYIARGERVATLALDARAGAAYVIACDASWMGERGELLPGAAAVSLRGDQGGADLFDGAAQAGEPRLHVGVYRHGDTPGAVRFEVARAAGAPAGARTLLFRCAAHERTEGASGVRTAP